MAPVVQVRDYIVVDDSDRPFWYSRTGAIVKWSIFGGIILIFFFWFVLGYFHAKWRVKHGQRPLLYHRFLVPYSDRGDAGAGGPQNQFSFYRVAADGQSVEQVAPPVYDHNLRPAPTYQPPMGSKIEPSSTYIPRNSMSLDQAAPASGKSEEPSGRAAWLKKVLPSRSNKTTE